MKIFKEIAARIWALWGIISFITTFLIFFIPSMLTNLLPDPRSSSLFIRIARLWMNIWLTLIGCPVTVKGKENFATNTTYIVTCNHNSLMDVPLSSSYIPGPNKTIAKTSFAKIPLFGFYYRKGSVLVDRKSELSRKESYRKMKQVLATGIHMCIYPEGTRNKTKDIIGHFHSGAFRLAVDTKNAILPGIIFNTKKALPNDKAFYLLPHKLEINFLPPIPVGENDNADQLKEKTHAIMKAHIMAQS